jgi:hypothetical protein
MPWDNSLPHIVCLRRSHCRAHIIKRIWYLLRRNIGGPNSQDQEPGMVFPRPNFGNPIYFLV